MHRNDDLIKEYLKYFLCKNNNLKFEKIKLIVNF